SLVSRLGFAGALAGAACGVFDYALAAKLIGPFLPTAPLRFCAFLIGLYGLAGGLAGLALGFLAALLARGDLGRYARGDEAPGERARGYALVAAASLGAAAWVARIVVEQALTLFHHRPLIAALSGAASAGAGAGVALVGTAIVPILSRVLPFGPRTTPTP